MKRRRKRKSVARPVKQVAHRVHVRPTAFLDCHWCSPLGARVFCWANRCAPSAPFIEQLPSGSATHRSQVAEIFFVVGFGNLVAEPRK